MKKKQKKWSIVIVSTLTIMGLVAGFFNDSIQICEKVISKFKTESPILKPKKNTSKEPSKEVNIKSTIPNAIDKDIKMIIEEARQDNGDVSNSYKKFMQAYELLPDSVKNRKFISKIKDKSFEAQNKYLDSFFVSLNY